MCPITSISVSLLIGALTLVYQKLHVTKNPKSYKAVFNLPLTPWAF